jgi:hypothetical protein
MVPWGPKAGSCTCQPLSAEHGACAAVCGRHDAAGLDGLHRWQQRHVPLVHVPDARGANRALELRAPTMLRRILMRLREVRILVPEGTLMCRTHTTQHELSAIAPNVQWVQLFASLGFAARLRRHPSRRHQCPPTSSSRSCTRAHARGCTLRHALPARKRLRPLGLTRVCLRRPPARPFRSRSPSPCSPRTGSALDMTWHPWALCHAPPRRDVISCEL